MSANSVPYVFCSATGFEVRVALEVDHDLEIVRQALVSLNNHLLLDGNNESGRCVVEDEQFSVEVEIWVNNQERMKHAFSIAELAFNRKHKDVSA